MSEGIQMRRVWAMPNAETFSIEPIHNFVWKYLSQSEVSIDPFARNRRWATYTNDLNPKTDAEYHMEAEEFMHTMHERGVKADLLILDPPYSPRQIAECYSGIGKPCGIEDTQLSRMLGRVRESANQILADNATVLTFGWSSVGMGKKFGFEIAEIMLVAHGGAHNDTICMAERRVQSGLFSDLPPATSSDYATTELMEPEK